MKKIPQKGAKAKRPQQKNNANPPTSYARNAATVRAPSFGVSQQKGDLRVRVKHREYVADIVGTLAFTDSVLPINPGLAPLFPWLSQIAQNFESYLFHELCFEYETQTATSNGGKVILSVDYDASDAPPTSKTQALQQRSKADGPVWENFRLNLDRQDLAKFGPQKYVRAGAEPGDIKTFDIGNLSVITQNCSNLTGNGELYVCYDVELITPSIANPTEQLSERIQGGGTMTATLLGTAPTSFGAPIALGSGVPNIAPSVGNMITFAQVGQYLLEAAVAGTGLTGFTASAPVVAGGIGSLVFSTLESLANAAATSLLSSFSVNVTNPGQQLSLVPGATAVTSSEVRIAGYMTTVD